MSTFLFDTMLMTGLLIGLVLLLRRPVGRMFGAQAAYALWLLPFLRLLLPPVELPASMAPQADAAVPVETLVVYAAEPAAIPVEAGFDWAAAGVALWLLGAVAFLAWRTIAYLRMRRELLVDAVAVGEAGPVRLVESPSVSAPVAFGVRDKVIALPMGFMGWHDRTARDLALAHELAHHQGHDLLINMLAQPVLALHWFNPLAWAGWRAMRRDQEAACDARVLAGQGSAVRADYGRLIAGLAGGPRLALAAPMACPVLGEKSIIHRLRSISMPEPTKTRRLAGRSLLIGAALALPLTATIGYAAPDAPEPPMPPAAPAAPEAPAAPDAPGVPKIVKRIVIVEKDGPAHGDESKLKTRVIERNGKTIVFKTDKDLTDAEIEAKIAKAEAAIPADIDVLVKSGHAPGELSADAAGKVRRMVIVHGDGSTVATNGGPDGKDVKIMRWHSKDGAPPMAMAFAGTGEHCGESEVRGVTSEVEKDGKKQVVKIRVCSTGAMAAAHALGGLKKARERISANTEMSAEIKAKVLEELDREIAKMAKGG
ncbi:MAG: M56 family metallopeptidase [Novosphingobium sp.]